jgi:serine/threonine-protein phosphatase 4 regulatory subunit 1
MMGELLEDVDPCETVEYVLPLLNGFAMDEGKSGHYHMQNPDTDVPRCLALDESVKEAFASQLHRVLWYYFTVSTLH